MLFFHADEDIKDLVLGKNERRKLKVRPSTLSHNYFSKIQRMKWILNSASLPPAPELFCPLFFFRQARRRRRRQTPRRSTQIVMPTMRSISTSMRRPMITARSPKWTPPAALTPDVRLMHRGGGNLYYYTLFFPFFLRVSTSHFF